MTWLTDIIRGLRALNGEARLSDLYSWIQRNRTIQLPPKFDSAIRAMLQKYCATCKQYDPRNPSLFANPSRGWWALRQVDPDTVKVNEIDLFVVGMQSLTEDELKVMHSEEDFFRKVQERGKERLLIGATKA